ncbi:MAG TPA: hypothetical protein VN372_13415 [Methanospirillum sp.]|nr:hypothetical protein [Methanospirillum sp.]
MKEPTTQTESQGAIPDELLHLLSTLKDGDLTVRADISGYEGDAKVILQAVNEIITVLAFPLIDNLNVCTDSIKLLISDTKMLSIAAIEGRLNVRSDASKHQGDFRKIIEGVNATLDAVINPLKEAMRMADEFAEARFSARMNENLTVAGEFVGFKDSLNNIGIQVQGAIGEIQRIADQYEKVIMQQNLIGR